MTIVGEEVEVSGIGAVVAAVRQWQYDAAPVQLHPGDIGWNQQVGAVRTAAFLRVWRRGTEPLAVAMLDEDVMRVAISPAAEDDAELAEQIAADIDGPRCVEARTGTALRARLAAAGWQLAEPWAPLRRDLAASVPDSGLRITVVTPDRERELVPVRVAVQQASFENSRFTQERWQAMAQGPAYADARCLIGYDEHDNAVAMTTVWSAGPGRPGLIEPLGAHRDHRGRGHGRAITLAAAAALQEMGSSSVVVATPAANVAAVAAYVSAGFERLPDSRDLRRPT